MVVCLRRVCCWQAGDSVFYSFFSPFSHFFPSMACTFFMAALVLGHAKQSLPKQGTYFLPPGIHFLCCLL